MHTEYSACYNTPVNKRRKNMLHCWKVNLEYHFKGINHPYIYVLSSFTHQYLVCV